jgi:Mn-dependent DtxR family transcriptional regulator
LNEINSSSRLRQTTSLEQIADALIAGGYTSLDQQAKALGICRSTAWTIIKTKHKLGRLNVKTTQKILANPETPAAVRAAIEKYLIGRSKLFWCSTKQN